MRRERRLPGTAGVLLVCWACTGWVASWHAVAQAQAIGSIEIRPFVTGLIPVIGRSGAVGGIAVDADGVVARITLDQERALSDARARALAAPSGALAKDGSPLRKISLRGLQLAIRQSQHLGTRYDDELQNLAGLQRAEYVFLDADHQDIVLAGPAESWRIDERGNAVGQKSGRPPLQLDDLIVALRTAKAAASERGISCSIDPTSDGLERLRPLLRARVLNEEVLARLEKALGPQQITITGVPPGSHFARVLVGADFAMKRLGMNFEPAPIDGLPSYLQLLQSPAAPRPKSAMPRWWMAPNYEPLLKDPAGLAWQLRGPGVRTHSEAGYLRATGGVDRLERDDPLAKQWAESMTSRFESLARAMPVFAELRNCMDLAVVAALLVKEDLPAQAHCDLSLLLDGGQVAVAEYLTPTKVDSRASFLRKGSGWILSLSGGVQIDSWSVLKRQDTSEGLSEQHHAALASRGEHWWWD